MYKVYVLKSLHRTFHYIGHTGDLPDRFRDHNKGKVRSTKAYRPFRIIYTETYATKSEAAQREYYLKTAAGNMWLRNHLKRVGVW
ncbi:MAG: GIY-YIG nuclease family protein [Candidatus Marinimicrobia bacterium]|nr:GIY-YIG nuclease family protein [Candidatus Neomarinimicrobiota bacterium]MCF7829644.1 GIY-YIG nuclease family protein [Candidatus Neomarinimicrobiota bacterium]MCF7879804.1 GIY-YIG nuclease family protein [Candidatus Neomarinimicrobiota bacterium]